MISLFRRTPALAAAVALAVLVVGCVRGEGPLITEQREIRPFSRIEVGAGIALVFRVGPAVPAEVRAQDDILGSVGTEVAGETLTIEARGNFISTEPVTVTVTAPTLESISLDGGASADIVDLAVEALEVSLHGGSRATLAGAAGALRLTANGGSQANLDGLTAVDADVALDGGSKVTARASRSVSGAASGGAELTVSGGAELSVNTSGGARVSAS
jgi:hypothetical protein